MSISTPKLSVIRLLAVKAETTTGTEMSVTGTDASLIVYDPKLARDKNTNERQQQAGKGQAASVPGIVGGSATFTIELAGSGTDGTSPAWALQLLPACDMAETAGAWAFTSGGGTVTIAIYEDGCKRILYGARGTFKITKENGKPGMVEFTFKGKYKEDADASILAPTFPTVLPDANHDTVTFDAVSPICTKIEVDAGNDVQLREDMNAGDGTGILGAAITNRKPVGSVDPEQGSLSGADWNSMIDAATQKTFSATIGVTEGNIVTIGSTTLQITGTERGDRNGIMTRDVSFQFNGTTPFSISF